ncbi:hypothetical protein [Polyangium mundeleinium]|uniref:Protein kinase domain-containing protein n=1 Tax=Polyangium mundeleinium TaxID=2995306 RepID=A0ABT5ENT4_9BACT|nr:hypothetical protein [Polyangium mundeleinium]MDC0743503.1 hypothetical protein [Polyangium mundeleinium]
MMKRARPEASGIAAGAPLPPLGRASRFACEGGRELFRLPSSDEAAARRLLGFGEASIGGFTLGGVDDEGVWVVRRKLGTSLAELVRERKGPWPWREALGITLAVAEGLAACEKASLFPGPLSLEGVHVDDEGAVVVAAPRLVGAILGAQEGGGSRGGTAEISPRWTPPEQAAGAVWDSAANRYVLGLLLYRLLAGEHPFAGAGLRHALDEAAQREAPPFVDAVARALPTGLQSLCLRLLDPDPARRPDRAVTLTQELGRFLRGESAEAAAPRPARDRKPAETRARKADEPTGVPAERPAPTQRAATAGKPIPAKNAWISAGLPIGAGLLVAALAFSRLAPAPAEAPKQEIAPLTPISTVGTTSEACASCHPRQAAEWRRSVMAHSVKSPLFNGLESLIEEQVGRDEDCPNGAGILRRVNASTACRNRQSGVAVTGSGGEHWCVNCHSPAEKIERPLPAWDGRVGGDPATRKPVRDLLGAQGIEGISCVFCHTVHGPVGGRGGGRSGYEGNPTWTSFVTGAVFPARPEDNRGLFGIANSGYELRNEELFLENSRAPRPIASASAGSPDNVDPLVHRRPSESANAYLRTSEFCGSCHDVRLFGSDVLGVQKGEHFKRLRNAYSEWAAWARDEERRGKTPATCQDCHMSTYPGVCEPGSPASGEAEPECPPGSHFVARAPGVFPTGRSADNSPKATNVSTHYFSGVDLPLSDEFPNSLVDETTIDAHGIPLGARRRRDLLLRHTFRFEIDGARRGGAGIEIPIVVENVGAGHRVPAGFSQEREFWVHLVVRDRDGSVVYEVGRVGRPDEDLHDKTFVRVNTNPSSLDERGRPIGLFGADVRDGVDVPRWSPPPERGGTSFRGKGLVNFQNGFLRCVRCIGVIGPDGRCEPGPGQGFFRADRFDDGDYDIDTGECRSNLSLDHALFETYFPVGALDASRGQVRGPDAIVDTRSLPPNVPIRFTYDLDAGARRGPFRVEARLLFRAFPPFLIRAFAAYEREQSRRGLRPNGPNVTEDMLRRLEIVELARADVEVP